MWRLFLIGSYVFLGGGIKFIDQVFDENIFSENVKPLAYLLAGACGLLMGYLVAIDTISAAIFLSLIISLGITRKIDNGAFFIGTLLVIGIPLVLMGGLLSLNWFILTVLVLGSIGDEAVNDYADRIGREKAKKTKTIIDDILMEFIYYRPIMKISLLALWYVGSVAFVYFMAFLGFDTAYSIVEAYSFKLIGVGRKGF